MMPEPQQWVGLIHASSGIFIDLQPGKEFLGNIRDIDSFDVACGSSKFDITVLDGSSHVDDAGKRSS